MLSTTGSMANTLGGSNPLRYRGYVYDTETELYYLQSRYYDPELGRFLNADALVSTGQGLLGNNMFAYCNNNPSNYSDPSGMCARCLASVRSDQVMTYVSEDCGGGSSSPVSTTYTDTSATGILGAAVIGTLWETVQNWNLVYTKSDRETYQYQQVLKHEIAFDKGQFPHIHHIIPVGLFSHRSAKTQAQIREMHSILKSNGINRFIDPINLMLVSAKTHASLHTDAYIAYVYSYIKQAAGSREEIYRALFELRIEIAAKDAWAFGY